MPFTKAELKELAEYDEMVEKGIDLYPLTAEQKQVEKEMRACGRVVQKGSTKRATKPNSAKQDFINLIAQALSEVAQVNITNAEREITFTADEKKYKLVLSCPRK